ncbi:MAG: PP2C family serine/threonine-protein phosphatase [Cyanobacteria bacterium P01_F01_bin.53]
MSWRAIARSAIGSRHQEHHQPCQDYGVVTVAAPKSKRDRHGVIIGVVADGAGSARHADVGAKLAVNTTAKYLVASETWLQQRQRSWQDWSQSPSEELFQKVFTLAVKKSQAKLTQQASAQGCQPDDLACTLLAFVATPDWIAAMQIGDGFLVVRYGQSQDNYHLLFEPDRGEFANQTTFVTATDALTSMQIRTVDNPPRFIAAATDGIERVALRLRDWTPFPPFFKPLEEYLEETPNPETDDAYLMSFLTSERLNQKTDDDKTLVLCSYHHQD